MPCRTEVAKGASVALPTVPYCGSAVRYRKVLGDSVLERVLRNTIAEYKRGVRCSDRVWY